MHGSRRTAGHALDRSLRDSIHAANATCDMRRAQASSTQRLASHFKEPVKNYTRDLRAITSVAWPLNMSHLIVSLIETPTTARHHAGTALGAPTVRFQGPEIRLSGFSPNRPRSTPTPSVRSPGTLEL